MSAISNIKVSFNIENNFLWKDALNNICKLNSFPAPVKKSNIIVIKCKYTFCIFEKKNNFIHFNVTGIKNFQSVDEFKTYFKNIFFPCEILNFKIDNITATFNLNNEINLFKLYEISNKVNYNPERFPGLFLKDFEKTCIIFKNGKVIILGCKSEKEINLIWRKVLKQTLNVIII
jgi:hypothetical protein